MRETNTVWKPWKHATPRVAALHADHQGAFALAQEFHDPGTLSMYLGRRTALLPVPRQSVYILESLSDEIIAVFESHFNLTGVVFEHHDRLVAFRDRPTGEGGGVPFLASAITDHEHVALKYHEPLLFSTTNPASFRNFCAVSGRHIAVTRASNGFSDIAVCRRKCSVWSRKTEIGGWECLIICDPPVRRVLTDYSGKLGYNVVALPYNARRSQNTVGRSRPKDDRHPDPPVVSLYQELIAQHVNQSANADLSECTISYRIVKKTIAFHYLDLAEHTQTLIEKIQFDLSRQQDLSSFAVSAVEERWSNVQALERRIDEYKDDIEAVMLQLRIPFAPPDLSSTTNLIESAADYQYLYMRFKELSRRVNSLNGSLAALAGITSNRQSNRAQQLALEATERSIREGKGVRSLTMLGIVFVPLAYVSSLLSMSDPYNPGGELFWVYFAVALPLIGSVVMAYQVLEMGYQGREVKWSSHVAWASIRDKFSVRHKRV